MSNAEGGKVVRVTRKKPNLYEVRTLITRVEFQLLVQHFEPLLEKYKCRGEGYLILSDEEGTGRRAVIQSLGSKMYLGVHEYRDSERIKGAGFNFTESELENFIRYKKDILLSLKEGELSCDQEDQDSTIDICLSDTPQSPSPPSSPLAEFFQPHWKKQKADCTPENTGPFNHDLPPVVRKAPISRGIPKSSNVKRKLNFE